MIYELFLVVYECISRGWWNLDAVYRVGGGVRQGVEILFVPYIRKALPISLNNAHKEVGKFRCTANT